MRRASEPDTIAAVATPPGEGGISVIRVSGPHAIEIVEKGFVGKKPLKDVQSQTAHFGQFFDSHRNILDTLIALVFRGPHSYTGEDVVEVSCHGGILVTGRILNAILEDGARLATPGEFTKRAFLNGKLDLSQAEAVADLIHSGSDLAHRSSLQQLEGRLSKQINSLRDRLIETVGLLELELDFVEEHLEIVNKQELILKVESTLEDLRVLLKTSIEGRVYREGLKVVLAGAPNAGKSSILNTLLNEDRAIVTEIPGTTRDTIEESLSMGGMLFRVVDTAGLRDTKDVVEQEGVSRTHAQIETSDILVYIIDSSRQPSSREMEKASEVLLSTAASKIVVLSKTDLSSGDPYRLSQSLAENASLDFVEVSVRTGQGVERLRELLARTIPSKIKPYHESSVTVTNLRHAQAIKDAAESLELALKTLKEGKSSELVIVDLRASLDHLGEITGAVTSEEILESIFARFCIGK
jgi:tRNA modification GTPase